jgi:two-component system nitrogen regulation sensor histidine kinase NtrY
MRRALMARSLATFSQPTWVRFGRWLRRAHVASRLAVVLTVAATLSGIATYVVLSGWLRFGADVDLVVGLLYLDVILLLLLGAVVARRLVQLVMARWQGSAGSRLHARMVALFSLVSTSRGPISRSTRR